MAIQFTDFSRVPLLDSPWENMLENVLKGYQISQEPAKMKEEQSTRQLANQLKELEIKHKPKEYALGDQEKGLANALKSKALEHYEEKFNLEKQYKQAQIQKALQQKIGGSPKANGELANFMVSHPDATPDEIRSAYEEIHGSKLAHEQAVTERSKDITAGNSFDHQPTNDKKQSVALMKGMGVDPVEAVSYLRKKGNSPSTYAKEKGIDIHTVTPDYAAGEQNIKIAQQAAAYMDELDNLEGHISAGLGKYQNKILGFSPAQIADASSNEDPETQGMVLASRALLPELNAIRLKIAGANIGIEALKELESKSLGTLHIFESLVSPEAYAASQKYMNQWIKQAGQARNKSLIGNSMLKTNQQKSADKESHAGKVYDLSTGQWENQ
jgi:hypothetical protein